MMKNLILLFSFGLGLQQTCRAQSDAAVLEKKEVSVCVENIWDKIRKDEPVCLKIRDLGASFRVKSALVKMDGKEVASQLDDLDGDGVADELAFVVDLKSHERKLLNITLQQIDTQYAYTPRVYAEMMVTDKKQNHIPMQSMTVLGDGNPFTAVYPHGPAFESELIGLRVYFDPRQTVDAYGKTHRRLELRETHFYPSGEQKAAEYGDDVLWSGNTVGAGTLRGWDGHAPTFISPVAKRTECIRAYGPVRTVVEVRDEGWRYQGKLINMRTRYILYAGHRDCLVDVEFDEPANMHLFCTGVINVKNSAEYTNHKGLLGCWGSDWAVDAKDSVGHQRETVGLAVSIPEKYVHVEVADTSESYLYIVRCAADEPTHFYYHLAFASGRERLGFAGKTAWFDFMKTWRERLSHPCNVTVQ